ncbi:MAG TPA: FecR domain-containing protein [Abditibacteriaceae bacterium]|jgi:hypothetical protein
MKSPGCLSIVVLCVLFGFFGRSSRAQTVARVAKIQRIAEMKNGDAAWKRAGVGTALAVQNRVRTGKRSKADIKFSDGSLLRLGQLSSVEFRSAKGVTLTGGQLLFAALKPGRVLAGNAAAEIKGSVAVIRLNPDNSVDAELFLGATDIVTEKGTVSLKPGQGITAFPDGTFSRIRAASPRAYLRGAASSELLDEPNDAPFTGSAAQIPTRTAPERTATETYQGLGRGPAIIDNYANPFVLPKSRSPFDRPFPDPLPPLPDSDSTANNIRIARTRSSQVTQRHRPALENNFLGALPALVLAPRPSMRLAQIPAATEAGVPRALDAANDAANPENDDLDIAAAQKHLEEIERGDGQASGVDAALIGVLGDGGTALYGGQLHGYLTRGKFLFDATIQPLRLRNPGGGTQDYSAVSSAHVLYRDSWGDVQLGRQRFAAGPTQATLFGSLVRQGSREVMDALRIKPRLKPGFTAEAAYLIDAYPRNLPYRVSGRQEGLYGRAGVQRSFGNFAVNALSYRDANTSTGVTLDFAVPLVRNEVELYGEFGRDVFKRRLTTVGLAFPVLYDRAGIDFALEYARLGSSSRTPRPPSELAARVYKRIGNNVNVVASLSRFSGAVRDTSLVVGVSVGARLTGGGSYSTME